jgi:hypothetical protein
MPLESMSVYLAHEINSTVFQQRGLLPLVVLLRLRHAGSRRTSECKVGQQATISDKHSKQISPRPLLLALKPKRINLNCAHLESAPNVHRF